MLYGLAMAKYGTRYVDVGWEAHRLAVLRASRPPFFQKVRAASSRPLQPEGGLAALRLRGLSPPTRAATSTAASTTSTWLRGRHDHGAPFDLNDDSVVVIVGSGAGGGTLGTELAPRASRSSSSKPAAATKSRISSTTNGRASPSSPGPTCARPPAVARREGFPEPARLDRQGRRRLDGPLGRRFAALPGARVQGPDDLRRRSGRQPARLADHPGGSRALLRQGRGQDGRDAHQRHSRACPATTIQGPRGRRQEARLQGGPYRPHGDQLAPTRRAPGCQQIGFCFQGCKSARNGRRSMPRSRRARRPASSKCGRKPGAARSSTMRPARSPASSMPTRTASCSARRRASSRSPAIPSRARGCCSTRPRRSSRTGSRIRRGRSGENYMRHMTGSVYAVFDKPVHM